MNESIADINLRCLVLHELGHSLGLSHSKVPGSVMASVLPKYDPNRRLADDDISGIQSLYGKAGVHSPEVKWLIL